MSFSVRHPMIRYVSIGIAAILLIILAVTPLVTAIVEGWSRRDVELRSRLVFRSIEDRVANAITVSTPTGLTKYFERLTEDEKLIALGYCDEAGTLKYATKSMPKDLACEALPKGAAESFSTLSTDQGRYLVSVFPISAGEKKGEVVLLHDLTFVDARARQARIYVALALIGGFLTHAGVTHDPDDSAGLDQALQKVLEQPFGPVMIVVIAAGFLCYGLFCFARARHLDR